MNNDKIRQRVHNNYAAFVADVDPHRLSDYLKEKGIISIEQWQDMCGKNPTDRHRCRALLDFLLSGNDPRAFVVVRSVLERENHYLMGEIDDEPSCLTEDKKTIKLLQFEVQSQEKRLQEAQAENEKFRKRVAELESELAKYHHTEKRQPNQSHSNKDKKQMEVKSTESSSLAMTDDTVDRSSVKAGANAELHHHVYQNAASLGSSDDEDYVNELQAEKLISSKKPMPIPRKGAVGTSLSVGLVLRDSDDRGHGYVKYVNESQAQQLKINAEQIIHMKRTVGASLSVPCFDGAGYVNSGQIQQKTRVEETPPLSEFVGNSLRGTLTRETASHWSSTSTVGIITGDCKAIIGVTVLRQKVYVIHDNSSQIQVYDSNTQNSWLSQFKLEDLREPKHLTSCGLNNCLYLTGRKGQTVFKAEGTGNAVLLTWKTEEDSYSLSTTKDGTVLLTGSITQALKEYTAYGTLLRTIIILKLDLSITINPWHSLKLESGNYLISHGLSATSKHRVCMISPDGDVLKSFGDEKGSEMNGLFGPYHLALDEKGNVLVADCNNRRIVVLSLDLQYVTEIKTDLRYPTRLCFDSSTGSLYVADNELRTGKRRDGQIVVLQPKH